MKYNSKVDLSYRIWKLFKLIVVQVEFG